jgi:hypothetical protein
MGDTGKKFKKMSAQGLIRQSKNFGYLILKDGGLTWMKSREDT